MSMTQEEAIKHLLHDWHINLGCDFAIKPGRLDDFLGALDVALSALRPITREQVERVWRGEWIAYLDGEHIMPERYYSCSKCGGRGHLSKKNFCDFCGAPMTDEGVDMVMERLEAMKDGNSVKR